MKVLIVDDDDSVLDTLKIFFETLSEGYVVTTAETAKDGLRKFDEGFDLVLLDIHLPDGDGVQVLDQMQMKDKKVPVVLVTAYKDATKVIEAFRKGAYDCLLKPFNFEYLRDSILKKISRRMI